jgi:hypothetical protein
MYAILGLDKSIRLSESHELVIKQYLINIRFVMNTTVNFLQFCMNHT